MQMSVETVYTELLSKWMCAKISSLSAAIGVIMEYLDEHWKVQTQQVWMTDS